MFKELMSFTQQTVYALGCQLKDGSVAILSRNSGEDLGPAFCNNRRDAVKFKTRLVNDPRGLNNHRAMEIIKSLVIFKLPANTEYLWETGSLWAYVSQSSTSCVESDKFWL